MCIRDRSLCDDRQDHWGVSLESDHKQGHCVITGKVSGLLAWNVITGKTMLASQQSHCVITGKITGLA